MVHYMVHYTVHYIVHYIVQILCSAVHYIVHYIVHYMVHYMVHYTAQILCSAAARSSEALGFEGPDMRRRYFRHVSEGGPAITYGCSLRHLRLQPAPSTAATCVTYGCSLRHPRLQAAGPSPPPRTAGRSRTARRRASRHIHINTYTHTHIHTYTHTHIYTYTHALNTLLPCTDHALTVRLPCTYRALTIHSYRALTIHLPRTQGRALPVRAAQHHGALRWCARPAVALCTAGCGPVHSGCGPAHGRLQPYPS